MCVGESAPVRGMGWVASVRMCVHACTGERAHRVQRKPWGSALATEPFLLLFKLDQRQ